MNFSFYKYQGTGNDFIIIDNRDLRFDPERIDWVQKLCHRKYGIGSDGLMLLQNKTNYDFELVFFNPDGSKSLCGNGSRCIVAFAKQLGMLKNNSTKFWAFDGEHTALISGMMISLKMNDVKNAEMNSDFYFLNNGSPHYVKFVKDIAHFNVYDEGKKIRYSERFKKEGTNVNFVENEGEKLFVRTYERGVENETLSCGTGVIASALATSIKENSIEDNFWEVTTLGGDLKVKFKKYSDNSFTDIWLEGPAEFVFKGEMEINENN